MTILRQLWNKPLQVLFWRTFDFFYLFQRFHGCLEITASGLVQFVEDIQVLAVAHKG